MTGGHDGPAESRWRRLLRHRLPHPRVGSADYRAPASHLLILVKGENPTFTYYLDRRLKAAGSMPSSVRDIDADTLDDIVPDGLFVVVCRYIRNRQLAWLETHRSKLAGVALFIDDDVSALISGRDGSVTYRLYLARFAAMPLLRLNRLLSQIWASTEALQHRLGQHTDAVELLPPSPVLSDHLPPAPKSSSAKIKLAFHATDIHDREHAFLVPIVKEVLLRRPDLSFEVLARGRNRRLWAQAGLDPARLSILPLAPWPIYRERTRATGADILLVPLLDGLGNAVRADTKRIDCCRMGAAAVFSEGEIYGRRRRSGEVHLASDMTVWIDGILALADDEGRRADAASATRSSVAEMEKDGAGDLPGLISPLIPSVVGVTP